VHAKEDALWRIISESSFAAKCFCTIIPVPQILYDGH
jgi:hypothetical protein